MARLWMFKTSLIGKSSISGTTPLSWCYVYFETYTFLELYLISRLLLSKLHSFWNLNLGMSCQHVLAPAKYLVSLYVWTKMLKLMLLPFLNIYDECPLVPFLILKFHYILIKCQWMLKGLDEVPLGSSFIVLWGPTLRSWYSCRGRMVGKKLPLPTMTPA